MWWLRKHTNNRLFRFVYTLHQYINSSSISWYARFAGKPCFPHGIKGIFVSGAAKIGSNCVIFQQVTIGSNTLIDSTTAGAPNIGDNVYIGAGAKIIGKVVVGNNVRIGANAVVYKDVPDNSVVISGEMKVFSKEGLDNRFYNCPGKWVCFEDGNAVEVTDEERLSILRQMEI